MRRAIITGMALVAVFVAITLLVVFNVTQSIDASLALAINSTYLGQSMTSLMVAASEYGREYFWIPIVAIMLIFGKKDTKALAIELAALFIVGIVAGEAMKFAMYRARPGADLAGIAMRVPLAVDSSYPSGHALIVFIGAFFALTKFVKSKKARGIAAVLLVEALLVSYSRVYVGAHYPFDVIGGAVLAGAITLLGLAALEKYFGGLIDRLGNAAVKAASFARMPAVL